MKKLLYSVFFILLGSTMLSCANGSFTEVYMPPVNDFWYTGTLPLHLSGAVHDDHNGGGNKLPLGSRIVVAWEMPNSTSRALYVYGVGTVSNIGGYKYKFDATIGDTLPKFILKGMDTTNAVGAAHILLVDDQSLKIGDTIKCDVNWDNAYHVIASMNEVGVIFLKGSPMLAGQSPKGTTNGFNLMEAWRLDLSGKSVTDYRPIPNFGLEIRVDDDGEHCKDQTPFWLQ